MPKSSKKPKAFFKGLEKQSPRLVASDPPNGAIAVTPQLYSDPEQRFAERRPFELVFDAAVHPADTNIGRIQLVDLDETSPGFPAGLPLGVHVRLLANDLDRAVALTPDHPLRWTNLSGVLARAGRNAEAITAANRALEVDPSFALALLNRAGALAQAGDFESAREDLKHALDLLPPDDPRRAQIEENLQLLER